MRRLVVTLVGLALLAGAGVGAWLVLRPAEPTPAAAEVAGAASQVITTVPAPQDLASATRLLGELPGSGLDALTPEARVVAEQAGVTDVLPLGATVEPDPTTWASTGRTATVEVRVAGTVQPPTTYVASLVRAPDGWRLLALTAVAP